MRIRYLSPVLVLFLAACLPAQPGGAGVPLAAATATRTPRPTATTEPTITTTPTQAFTPTPDPAIYDPDLFGDVRQLESFAVTITAKRTGQGEFLDYQTRTEYSRTPFQAHESFQQDYSTGSDPQGGSSSHEAYWLGDWSYRKDNLTGLWSVANLDVEDAFIGDLFRLDDFDLRTARFGDFDSATYLGIEPYNGIPAYHYTFDQTNLVTYLTTFENIEIDEAEGEMFVSVEGRYPLHAFVRITGEVVANPGSPPHVTELSEWTMDLASFNQPVEISLPEDYPDFDLELDLPLPPGSVLSRLWQTPAGQNRYVYLAQVDLDGYNAFYSAVGSVNGWSAPAAVDVHRPDELWCDGCFSLSRGNERAVLEYRREQTGFGATDWDVTIRVYFGLP